LLIISEKQCVAHCTNPDSIYTSIETSDVSDTVKAKMYVDFAINHRVGYPQLSINSLHKAKDIYEKTGREIDAAAIRGFIAQIYAKLGLNTIAAEHFMLAYKTYAKLDDNISLAWLFVDFGNLYYEVMNYNKAMYFYQKSIEKFRANNYHFGISVNLLNFGLIKEKQEDYPAALRYFDECLEIRRQLNDSFLIAHVYSYIGRVYTKLGEYEKANTYFYNSIELINALKDKIDIIEQQLYTDYNLLSLMYKEMQRSDIALLYADTALKTAQLNNDTINIINAFIYLSEIYGNKNRYKESVAHLEHALFYAKEHYYNDDVIENIHMNLIKAHLKLSNIELAEKHINDLKNYKSINKKLDYKVQNDNLDMVINNFLKEITLEDVEDKAHLIKMITYVLIILFFSVLVIIILFFYYKNSLYKNHRHLINTAFDGILLHINGIIFDVNESFLKFTGYSYKELKKSNIFNIIDPAQHEIVRENISLNKNIFLLTKIKLKDNTYVDIEVEARAYEYAGKKMRLITVRDISEKIKVQEQIQLFKTIIEQNFSAVIITDTLGYIEYINPSFTRITGYNAEEVLGKTPRILKSGYHDESFYKNLWEQINKGYPWSGVLKNIDKKGNYFWEETNITPIKDKNGSNIKFVAIKRDITKNIQLEEELKTYSEQLKIIFEGLLALVFVVDYETEEIIFTNNKVELILGMVEGKHVKDLILDKEEGKTLLPEKQINEDGSISEKYLKKEIYLSEKKLWYDVEYRKINWVNGRKAILILADDITEKKETILALNEINASKDKFFSIISHDLRNPFQGLLGFSDLLKNNVDLNDVDTIRMIIENIHSVSKTSYDLLEKLLEWAKIQKGIIKINKEKSNLNLLVDEQVKYLILLAQKKSITIEINIDKELTVKTDVYVITTVLRNLINNAIKFTPNDVLIKIEAQVKNDEVLLMVRDNGIGIPKEMLSSMFRIDTKYSILGTEGEKGAGLGLIICKELLELQESKIFVESTYNKGSTFSFTLELFRE